ncbi:hypothetical protein HF918_01830 [Acidithiobacillus ferriphilus]|nr:hypothetical protein [Acidithiobacillus ferriphilus]
MHVLTQALLYLLKFGPHPVAASLSLEQECSAPGLAADEDEPQEGEGFWLAQSPPLSVGRG